MTDLLHNIVVAWAAGCALTLMALTIVIRPQTYDFWVSLVGASALWPITLTRIVHSLIRKDRPQC